MHDSDEFLDAAQTKDDPTVLQRALSRFFRHVNQFSKVFIPGQSGIHDMVSIVLVDEPDRN